MNVPRLSRHELRRQMLEKLHQALNLYRCHDCDMWMGNGVCYARLVHYDSSYAIAHALELTHPNGTGSCPAWQQLEQESP